MLLCTCAHLFSCVQLFATSWAVACQTDPMEFSRQIQERVAMSSSRVSSPPRDQTCISCMSYIGRWILYLGSLRMLLDMA